MMDEGLAMMVATPNYTPVDDRKGYIDLGGYRILVEDGELVGVYPHGGLEDDPVLGVGD